MKNRIIYHFTNIRSRYIIALSKEEFDTIMQTGLAQAKADDSLAMDDAFNQLKAEI